MPIKCKLYYSRRPRIIYSATDCWVNYQLLHYCYRYSPMGNSYTPSGLAWHPLGRVFAPHCSKSIANCGPHLHRAIRGGHGVLPCVAWGVTASQLDLPSLTPLYVAGCGRLQLGTLHLGYFSSITASSWWLTPHSVVVDSALGGSWP